MVFIGAAIVVVVNPCKIIHPECIQIKRLFGPSRVTPLRNCEQEGENDESEQVFLLKKIFHFKNCRLFAPNIFSSLDSPHSTKVALY